MPTQQKAHRIVCNPQCIDTLAKSGISAFSIANNHAMDSGISNFRWLIDQLDTRNIPYFGSIDRPFLEIETDAGKVAVIGCLEACRSRGKLIFPEERVSTLIQDLRPRFHRIYVTPHWGKESEFCLFPSAKLKKLAAAWAMVGADGVFGHHPHTIHGMDKATSQPVYYSLGGFSFRHPVIVPHPFARIGLVVSIDPHSNSKREHFIYCGEQTSFEIAGDIVAQLDRCFTELSSPLNSNWSHWQWAKHDGADYLAQADASWRVRFSKSRWIKTASLYAAWSLLPSTLLARMGRAQATPVSSTLKEELNQISLRLSKPI